MIPTEQRLFDALQKAARLADHDRRSAYVVLEGDEYVIDTLGTPAEGAFLRVSPGGTITSYQNRRSIPRPGGNVNLMRIES